MCFKETKKVQFGSLTSLFITSTSFCKAKNSKYYIIVFNKKEDHTACTFLQNIKKNEDSFPSVFTRTVHKHQTSTRTR